ncbi:hypothetical protein KA405_03070 [Patescibacteria group bacterium]|nr:hypothetical protein [Patescibacteria group bacterium]
MNDTFILQKSMEAQSFPLSTQRHSLAHLLAQALQRYIDPTVQLGT